MRIESRCSCARSVSMRPGCAYPTAATNKHTRNRHNRLKLNFFFGKDSVRIAGCAATHGKLQIAGRKLLQEASNGCLVSVLQRILVGEAGFLCSILRSPHSSGCIYPGTEAVGIEAVTRVISFGTGCRDERNNNKGNNGCNRFHKRYLTL